MRISSLLVKMVSGQVTALGVAVTKIESFFNRASMSHGVPRREKGP